MSATGISNQLMAFCMKDSLSLLSRRSLDGADRLLTTSCQEPVTAAKEKARDAPKSMRGPDRIAGRLEHVARKIRQPGAFPARQRDVPAVRPALELVDCKGKARGAFGEVGRIDLR